MKLICASAEASLCAVRSLSENAVSRPWDRQLRCVPWPPRSAAARLVPVYQPWRTRGVDEWRGFMSDRTKDSPNEYVNRSWVLPARVEVAKPKYQANFGYYKARPVF